MLEKQRTHYATERLARTLHSCYHDFHNTSPVPWADLSAIARVSFRAIASEALHQMPKRLPTDV